MGRIFLLRHAKAIIAQPGARDFERSLELSGKRDADALGRAMLARGLLPDAVRCSAAKRTRDTLAAVSGGWPPIEVDYLDTLFSGDMPAYFDAIRAATTSSIMLVGHNPMTEALAFALLVPGQATGTRLVGGFPTAGLAVIDVEGDLADVQPATGQLAAFITPKDL